MEPIQIYSKSTQGLKFLYLMYHKGISFGHFGVAPMLADDATNLFEIIEDRTELNSTIITSQLPVSEWYNYLNNNTIADAILDRIVHSSHRVELSGPSMRKIKSSIKSDEYA